MTQQLTVGHVSWSPGYRHSSAIEAGDVTFVRPRLSPPAPANDNIVSAKPRIIGLMGYAGSGKTTVSNILRNEHGFTQSKFAGPLKSMMRALYGTAGLSPLEVERRIEGDLKDIPDQLLGGRTPRQAMQWLGTDWGRGLFGTEFWVGMWAAGVNDNKRYVVDDCRFQNEADAIRFRGGIIVRIDRAGVGPVNGHISEALPTSPDSIIKNNGSIADLYDEVAAIAA